MISKKYNTILQNLIVNLLYNMKHILILIFLLNTIIYSKITFAQDSMLDSTCQSAKLNIDNFLSASIGKMIKVSQMRIAPNIQDSKLEQILSDCVDISKVSKRVLGRAKWNSLTEKEQQNFLTQYPIYFIKLFRNVILQSIKGVQTFELQGNKVKNNYDILLKFYDKNKQPIKIILRIEQKNNQFKITDGEFLNVSVVSSQRQMFDRINDENPKAIKNFKASDYFEKK